MYTECCGGVCTESSGVLVAVVVLELRVILCAPIAGIRNKELT